MSEKAWKRCSLLGGQQARSRWEDNTYIHFFCSSNASPCFTFLFHFLKCHPPTLVEIIVKKLKFLGTYALIYWRSCKCLFTSFFTCEAGSDQCISTITGQILRNFFCKYSWSLKEKLLIFLLCLIFPPSKLSLAYYGMPDTYLIFFCLRHLFQFCFVFCLGLKCL